MVRPEVPQVIEVTTTETEVSLSASEVVLRARSSNVLAISDTAILELIEIS